MDSYNTDDSYNNDDLSTGGHDSHGIDIPSSEDGQFTGIHVDDSSLHDAPSSTSPMGVNNVNVLTESTHTHTQGQEISEVGETTGYQDQLRNILNPHGQATASSANGSESGYNETLTEIKHQRQSNWITMFKKHSIQKQINRKYLLDVLDVLQNAYTLVQEHVSHLVLGHVMGQVQADKRSSR